jgi:hypothetical protein
VQIAVVWSPESLTCIMWHPQFCHVLLLCCVLQVLAYLQAFADNNDLRKHIQLLTPHMQQFAFTNL